MIPLFKVFMEPWAADAAREILLSGSLTQGCQVEKFERLLASFLGYPYLATVNSGTSAISLALRLAGVKAGDEVVSTPLTCFATNVPILAAHATIRWADVDPDTCNIDPVEVEQVVTDKTAAVVVVHWGGNPVNVGDIRFRLVRKLGYCPPLIEDCAHAFGALYQDDTKVGGSGNYCAFSFQAIKHLTTGDGGLLCTPRDSYHRAKILRWFGIDRERTDFANRNEIPVEEWGYKYHMNDISAAIGIGNLASVEDKVIRVCQENAAFYNRELSNVGGIKLIRDIGTSSYWLYTLRVECRSDFERALSEAGIAVSQVHVRNDTHPCLSSFRQNLPKLDSFYRDYTCIPVGWWVTAEDREYIVECIRKGW